MNSQNHLQSQTAVESVQPVPVTVDLLAVLLQNGYSPVSIILAIALLIRVLMPAIAPNDSSE